jgi:SulP family sulfate permease
VLGELPMAAMAALLLMVAWRMADLRHFMDLVRTAPRGDVVVLLSCCALTIVFDMVVGVIAGMGLATMVFLRDMSRVTASTALGTGHPDLGMPVPADVSVYAIEGPLFFGAAERALNALRSIGRRGGVVVLDVESVPTIDATGLANLRSVLHLLQKDGTCVVLTGVHIGLRLKLEKARLRADDVHVFEQPKLRDGVAFATTLVQRPKA